MDICDSFKSAGWCLDQSNLNQRIEKVQGNVSFSQMKNIIENTDLKEIGDKILPENINGGKVLSIPGNIVLQVGKIRNLSASKAHEHSSGFPRMLKVDLTDGHMTCSAVEIEKVDCISLDTAPGTKLRLKGAEIKLRGGYILLTKAVCEVLGGKVDHLYDKWLVNKSLANHQRNQAGNTSDGSGPPKWVPFGKGLPSCFKDPKSKFSSLDTIKKPDQHDKSVSESAFEQQVRNTIAQAGEKKQDGVSGKKIFGGTHTRDIIEKTVKSVQEMSLQKQRKPADALAVKHVVEPSFKRDDVEDDRGGRRGGRRDGGRRGRRGQDEEEEGAADSRPSGPSTLFDFLKTHIPEKERFSKQQSSPPSSSINNGYNNNYSSSDRSDYQRNQPFRSSNNFDSRDKGRFNDRNDRNNGRNRTNNFDRSSKGGRDSFRSSNDRGSDRHDDRRGNNQKGYDRNESYRSLNPELPKTNSDRSSTQNGRYEGDKKKTVAQSGRSGDSTNYSTDKGGQSAREEPRSCVAPPPGLGPVKLGWKNGDLCKAKYWEDGQFHRAKIFEIAEDGHTCVVEYLDYGNYEEIHIGDLRSQHYAPNEGTGNARQTGRADEPDVRHAERARQPDGLNMGKWREPETRQTGTAYERVDRNSGTGSRNEPEVRGKLIRNNFKNTQSYYVPKGRNQQQF